ncbi:MAG: hypothetical protein JW891_05635 [Candidatus Lokiarchaeota archaeon]|nr:hypothetical protein [Candidatus Lokiarchaeota archaeon]
MTTNDTEDDGLIRFICPYCSMSFKKAIELQKTARINTILIKNHPEGKNCRPFIAFIDSFGKHRGSQKIDNVEEAASVNNQIIESSLKTINELEDMIRFYHLKLPRGKGRGFEHKVSNVTDRAVMSSQFYVLLVESLVQIVEDNVFGIVTIEKDNNFEGGLLVYGKYNGMIYSIFWRDQKSLQEKSLDDLRANANLTIEQLLDIYNLLEFFY